MDILTLLLAKKYAKKVSTSLPVISFDSNNRATCEGLPFENGVLVCAVFASAVGGENTARINHSASENYTTFYIRWLDVSGSIRKSPSGYFKAGRPYLFRIYITGGNYYLIADTVFEKSTTVLPVANGGTGASTPAEARHSLGIDTDYAIDTQHGTVTLTNAQQFPFNDSAQTVALDAALPDTNYAVVTQIVSAVGNPGEVEVSDKLTNGFKLSYNGSASSVVVDYIILGGFVEYENH